MLYSDVKEAILLQSGQYITDLDSFLLDDDKLRSIIKVELLEYSKWKPLERFEYMEVYEGKKFDNPTPKTILSVQSDDILSTELLMPDLYRRDDRYRRWIYQKPHMVHFRSKPGYYHVRYLKDREITPVKDKNDNIVDYEIDIDMEQDFINLVLGRFLMTVSRMSRTFESSDLPFNVRSDDLMMEGREIYQSAKDYLVEVSAFHLSFTER